MLKDGLLASQSVMASTNLKKKRLRVTEIKENSRCEAVKLWWPHSHGHLLYTHTMNGNVHPSLPFFSSLLSRASSIMMPTHTHVDTTHTHTHTNSEDSFTSP